VTQAPRRRAGLVLLAAVTVLAGAGCGGDDDGGAGAAVDSEAEGASEAFCGMAADFQEATASVPGIADADEMQQAVDQLDEVAAEAPQQMADEFAVLTGVLERLVMAMRSAGEGDAAATVDAMQKVLTPETAAQVEDASRNVEAFLEVECGIADEPAGGEDAAEPESPPTSTAPGDPAALGNDPALAPLAAACHEGDMLKCDELYFAAPTGSPYETYGDTCGNRTRVDEFCVDVYPPPATTTTG
jgi:hypothetical protein